MINKIGFLNKKFKSINGNIDLNDSTFFGHTPINYVFCFNKSKKLNLNNKQLDYLIKNSDLRQVDRFGWSPLIYALKNEQEQILTKEQWQYLIENSDLSLVTSEKLLFELKLIKLELTFFNQINNLSQKIINLENEITFLNKGNYLKNKKII